MQSIDQPEYDEIVDSFNTFTAVIPKDMKLGKEYAWECPLCGGAVYGGKTVINEHVYAKCTKCGYAMFE